MKFCSSRYKHEISRYIFHRHYLFFWWVATGYSHKHLTRVFPDSGQQHQSYIGVQGDVAMIPKTPPSIPRSLLLSFHITLSPKFLPHSHSDPFLSKASIAFYHLSLLSCLQIPMKPSYVIPLADLLANGRTVPFSPPITQNYFIPFEQLVLRFKDKSNIGLVIIKNKKIIERKQAVQAQHDCDRWLNMLAKGSPVGQNYCSGNKRWQIILFIQCNILPFKSNHKMYNM